MTKDEILTVVVLSGTILSFIYINWWVGVIMFVLGSILIGWGIAMRAHFRPIKINHELA